MDAGMSLPIVGSLLALSLAAGPAPHTIAAPGAECTSGEDHAVEAVALPSGGRVETITTASSIRMNFSLDGERVLTASETDGRADVEWTEYGLKLSPERAAEFRDELITHARAIMESPERCAGSERSKADQNAKCGLIGLGAAALGGLAGTALGGPVGGFIGGAAGGGLGVLCNWIVDKACENSSEGC